MKKLLLIAGILASFMACQKEETKPAESASFTVNVPLTGVRSKAGTDAFGTGKSVNRCILEIYCNDKLYDRIEKDVTDGQIVFDDLGLIAQKTYTFVFWADCAAKSGEGFEDKVYDTSNGLKAITGKGGFTGNSDERDAFFTCMTKEVTGPFTESVTLKRPFGLLTIKANDLNNIKDANKPTGYSITIPDVPTTFDAATGEASAPEDLTYTSDTFADAANGIISRDFILASKDCTLYDFSMTFVKDGTDILTNDAFKQIPIKRNHRTNVSGNLLTNKGTFTAQLSTGFEAEDSDQEVAEVSHASDIHDALMGGATNVVITETPTAAAEIIIPNIYTEEDSMISINIPETEHQITLKASEEGNDEQAPAVVNLTIPSSDILSIDLPNSTVIINGGTHGEISAETADNTLVVNEDATIEKLTVKKGNVKLYGKVNALTRNEVYSGTIYRCIGSQKSFDNLTEDKTTGYDEILIENATEAIDGKNASLFRQITVSAPVTISNLNIEVDYAGAYGLKITEGSTDVVMDNIKVSSTKTADRTVWIEGSKSNCTFTNSTFLVPLGTSNKSGMNISPQTADTEMTITLDNVLISTVDEKINVDKDTDYPYSDEIKNTVPSYSRGITIGQKENTTTEIEGARVNLTIRNSVIERLYYSINMSQNFVTANVNVENTILDGRASVNLWGQSSKSHYFTFKNSKLIGRNWFGGPTEEFASLVFNQECRNFNVTLDNCDVVSDNDPQTATNRQYLASMRSNYLNTLALMNGTRFREVSNPRLEHIVDFNPDAWINKVTWDDTFRIIGKDDTTVLPDNVWDGNATSAPGKAIDGKYYIGTAEQLATWVSQKTGGEAILVRDLDLDGKEWPVSLETKSIAGSFNGGNHTISNLKCTTRAQDGSLDWDNKAQNAGLFGCYNGTIQNLTIDGAEIYGSRSGVLVGRLDGGTIENCHVKNARITGGAQKNSAFIGYVSTNSGDVTISNCTVTDASVMPDPNAPEGDATCMAAGFIGYMQTINNVTIENNTLTNVSVESGKLWDTWNECASHTFIGNIVNITNTTNDKSTVTLTNNRLVNCTLDANATILATDFFGFYYKTAPQSHPYLNTIIVDGQTFIE